MAWWYQTCAVEDIAYIAVLVMNALHTNGRAKSWISLAAGILALVLSTLGHATEAGKFQFVVGDLKVISASGAERIPVKGDTFNPGESIVTGPDGTAQIRMSDGGLVAVRRNTQMKLDTYVFNGREDGSERKVISLVKGGFRAITGLIGNRNKKNYQILTPNATIGIRGTDHEAVVLTTDADGYPAGTYDRVYRGATIIETEIGRLIVNPNQVGFTPGKGVVPVLLPKIPGFFDTRSQKPDGAPDALKEADTDPGDSQTSDSTRSDSSKSLRADLPEAVGTVAKQAAALSTPLDAPTAQGQSGRKDRKELLATPLADAPIAADQSFPSTRSTQTAADPSNLKAPTSNGKVKEATSAQVPTAIPGPVVTATTVVPVVLEAANVAIEPIVKSKGPKKP